MVWKKILLDGDAASLSSTAPLDVDFLAASYGTADTASRQDHKHDLDEGVVGTILAITGAASTLGTNEAVAHLDHRHALGPLVSNLNFGAKQASSMALDVQTVSTNASTTDGCVFFNTTDDHPYVYVA